MYTLNVHHSILVFQLKKKPALKDICRYIVQRSPNPSKIYNRLIFTSSRLCMEYKIILIILIIKLINKDYHLNLNYAKPMLTGSKLCFIKNVSPFSTEDITDWLQVAGAEFGLPNTPKINQPSNSH